jgi:hypothetical protein
MIGTKRNKQVINDCRGTKGFDIGKGKLKDNYSIYSLSLRCSRHRPEAYGLIFASHLLQNCSYAIATRAAGVFVEETRFLGSEKVSYGVGGKEELLER